jgi:uncharacterized protein
MSRGADELGAAVQAVLRTFERVAVAVSGGIDSLTLATLAGRSHDRSEMFHAVSPAVPPEATARVKEFAAREGWQVHLLDAHEFERGDYVSNPVNRCFYCKQSLYGAIQAIVSATTAQIVSGTNLDDLSDYRPGLDAAREYHVRHPFAELGIRKDHVRGIARWLNLGDVADLPASPCLSSRVETGLVISPALLRLVHGVEVAVSARISARSVRCRVRSSSIVVEIDAQSLARLSYEQRAEIIRTAETTFGATRGARSVELAEYRTGSAFLVKRVAEVRH